jgi:hypothetical protein
MFIDDLKANRELIDKLTRNIRLTSQEKKTFEEFKEKWGLSSDGTIRTQEALGETLGVARQTIIRWKKEGMPVEADGSYDPIRISKWRDLVYPPQEKLPTEKSENDEVSWETEFRKYRAKLAELSFKQKLGELILRADVESLLVDRAVEFRRALLDMGRRLSLKLAHKDSQQIQSIIETEATDILDAYSREHDLGKPQAVSEEDLIDVDTCD